jgi:hypothetical protein
MEKIILPFNLVFLNNFIKNKFINLLLQYIFGHYTHSSCIAKLSIYFLVNIVVRLDYQLCCVQDPWFLSMQFVSWFV